MVTACFSSLRLMSVESQPSYSTCELRRAEVQRRRIQCPCGDAVSLHDLVSILLWKACALVDAAWCALVPLV